MPRVTQPPPPELKAGDTCWLLRGTLLHEVRIVEVRTILEGEPHQFHMYRVEAVDHPYNYINEQTQHRSDLFLKPEQRADLIGRLEGDIESLGSTMADLEHERDEEEAAQEENPREKGDDDGVEYADPRDRLEDLL
jgi:hypothetical protein